MKKIISMLLIITTLFALCTINVSAAREEEFLSEVALVYEDSVEEARAAIAGTDWKLWEQDLNPKADYMIDDGVYLIYKTSTNVEDAITDLRVMDMYGGYSTSNYENQLEATRKEYMQAVDYIRIAAAEFKELYNKGDEMAKLAYRQMNYYKDIGETEMLMGDFLLNIPSDEKLVTVMMEGNSLVITNLITLLAVGISGGDNGTLAERIAANYENKDAFNNTIYYDVANLFIEDFVELAAAVKRYDALADEYDLTDEEMSEEEYDFLLNYASVALILDKISYGEGTLKDFILKEDLSIQDLCPIIGAFTEGQLALADIGVLTTVLQYSVPSKPINELYKLVEEAEKELRDENGNLRIIDVYLGVDRSIFDGNFAFTNAAERQQALTGKDWTSEYYLDEEALGNIPIAVVSSVASVGIAAMVVPKLLKIYLLKTADSLAATNMSAAAAFVTKWKNVIYFLGNKKAVGISAVPATSGVKILAAVGVGLVVAAAGIAGISVWYGYYNPDYTPIPDNMVDVRETDIGDKYIKYTAAKVYNDEEGRNADLNAYEGKEWNALYYTKDATAGSCLTPKFVYKDNDSTIARRHQGISMFGESEAFNLNSHVYSKNAPGVYVTIRYSTTEKAAAKMPSVVGSMVATGALYTLTALGGAGLGVGGTLLVQKARKKKETAEPETSTEE